MLSIEPQTDFKEETCKLRLPSAGSSYVIPSPNDEFSPLLPTIRFRVVGFRALGVRVLGFWVSGVSVVRGSGREAHPTSPH